MSYFTCVVLVPLVFIINAAFLILQSVCEKLFTDLEAENEKQDVETSRELSYSRWAKQCIMLLVERVLTLVKQWSAASLKGHRPN